MAYSFSRNFFTISCCLGLLLASCNKDIVEDPAVVPPPAVDTLNVPQYGTPFNKVPDTQDIVIYQVNMRAFSQKGNFAEVTAKLDYIKDLGANVIYLMPISPVGTDSKSINSPYCITDHTAVGAEFGTLADLRALVDGAHNRGMAVILDWLANYTAWSHKWIKAHPDWYLKNAAGEIISPPNYTFPDVAALDFNNQTMRLAQAASMKYWVLAANVDGFRCDVGDNPPLSFWKQAIDTLKTLKDRKLIMFSEGTRASNYTIGFDMNFGFNFYYNLKEIYATNRSVQSIADVNLKEYKLASESQRMVRYTTNHDVNSSDGTPEELFGGQKGAMGAFIMATYIKGIPMIYNGQEISTPYRLSFPFTKDKIDWTINPARREEYKKVIALYNSSVAARRGTLTQLSNVDVCVFIKSQGNEKVAAIINCRNTPVGFSIPEGLVNTTWNNVMNGGSVTFKEPITLQPYSYMLLKN